MKRILGLDLGTNSIGWAFIEQNFEKKEGKILGLGSRIIPMSQDILGKFGEGNSISQTAERTNYRSVRRLRERHLLRRERLHRILNLINFLPLHYSNEIDFEKKLGQFKEQSEPKIAFKKASKNYEFIFKASFNEMVKEFRLSQPQMFEENKNLLIPYDWTIYYLRKVALSKRIEKEELAWIILNFNQKRGYYQLRGEEEDENPNKLVEYHSLKVIDVSADEAQKGKSEIWYSLQLENGWVYRRSSKTPLFDWLNKTRDFIVTTDLNNDGSIKTDKEGKEKRSFRAPSETDWTLLKKKTEQEITNSSKTVGEFIYDELLNNPKQKIKGKLVKTIERKFYKQELLAILNKQKEFHEELSDNELYHLCIRELYRNNDAHKQQLGEKNLVHLIVDDIIFYQRPLRSQKSNISNCSLEYRKYKTDDGNEVIKYLKAIPKSNPYFQEFRIWQWIFNLSIYRVADDQNITAYFISSLTDYEQLFEFLNNRKEVDQTALLKFIIENKGFKGREVKAELNKYRWNYVQDKAYPCNETRTQFNSRLAKILEIEKDILSRDIEQQLWHLIYSVTDKIEYEKALKSFAQQHEIDTDKFVDAFIKFPPFKSEYGSFSEKAIKKLLPLMRVGKFWAWENIDLRTQERIEHIIHGEFDEKNKNIVREKAVQLTERKHFQHLPLWLAQYVIYNRHSESASSEKWSSIEDLETYLTQFKQHSLKNPIVEQVITETLRVVKDVWKKFGQGSKDFFDEIHVELGREMKNTAADRQSMTSKITENENTNLRIKALLAELQEDTSIENVRAFSPSQQEILKIYEDGVLKSGIEITDEILKISKTAQPSSADLKRYKLWLEQKYRSPYTGEIIPLNKLFTPDYEIEHIIPQSRYFDDSLSNKVICESAVNKLKDNQIGLAFIKNHHGEKVHTANGKTVQIFEVESYEEYVKENYAKNRSKRNKLLLEEIPEKMIERQLNDTRYISKFISNLLSNIVREEFNDDGINSKKLLAGNGKVTAQLKKDWGLNDVWNELILPRFERLNTITESSDFTTWNDKYQKFLPTVPLEYSKGFSKKRIDHRHHAMDALVIACATRDHINLMNNQAARSLQKRIDLQNKLRSKVAYFDQKAKKEKLAFKAFFKPWDSFTTDAKVALDKIVVSFKQNLRVINKATNYYEKWVDKDGKKVKEKVKQVGVNWAIRKPMHKETVSGKVTLDRIKVPKGKILTATRKRIDASFNLKTIESITDTGIQKILKNYLEHKGGNPEIAFSPEGLEDMNKNIQDFNNGKNHQPIFKARVFETGSKFQVGYRGNKKDKYVEAAKGTNLFFAIYADANGKRNYATIPLNEVIERQKQGLSSVPETNPKGDSLLFTLSPNDLVFVPEELEEEEIQIDGNKVYRMVSCTGSECHFLKANISTLIKSYDSKTKVGEMGSLNKLETTPDFKIRIKERCQKIKVDRLGYPIL